MPLDGAFLRCAVREMLDKKLIGARVDKIHQPSRDEIIITVRTFGGAEKILLSAESSSARVCLTQTAPENPQQPPMFCMLMRKALGGGRLTGISQDGLERIINFDFECTNEIGDICENRVAAEIMGKYSNIILLTKKEGVWRVIDSIKRVTDDISSVRRILPNIIYELPPREERLCLADENFDCGKIGEYLAPFGEQRIAKALMSVFEGISPIFARECAYRAARDTEARVSDLNEDRLEKLAFFLKKSAGYIKDYNGCTMVCEKSGKPKDFCFVPVEQYGAEMTETHFDSPSELIDRFFGERATADRVKQRSGDLLKTIMTIYERISRKIEVQKQELRDCADKERYRLMGDILSANLWRAEKGMSELTAEDYVNGGEITIKLDVRLTPPQNAQKFYSEYKKLDTAEKMLTKFISQNEKELEYIDSVFDAASRVGSGAGSEAAIFEIKQELMSSGYIRSAKTERSAKAPKTAPPLKFRSSDGFEILVGRNNLQNDKLTLKTALPNDMWLHTQNIPGSHVIIRADGQDIPDSTIVEAAQLAATCSKGRSGTKIPVDYTLARYVKKPNGAKPGMVIFVNNKTILVDPDEALYERLAVK
ncbi:MAG: NFACT family protein [Ruminiclostridium sp.]|nr:NFACT family protein [Ruminiclostridium sp.]